MFDRSKEASASIIAQCGNWRPEVGMVLGSGLGSLIDEMKPVVAIDYQDIPGFSGGAVQGHARRLVLGELAGQKVACLQGRAHFYEGVSTEVLRTMVRTLKRLGCHTWLATNAVGSLNIEVMPGQLVLINDHINFQGINPLVGENDPEMGPRFFPLNNAYDADLRALMHEAAQSLGLTLPEGVYISVLGPNYETAAEIRAFRAWGADVVGMSTVPEVLVAHHCGMKVVVVSMVTNLATGLSSEPANHEEVIEVADQAADQLRSLITEFLGRL